MQIYNYALTDTKVAHIGTEGTGYVPLLSIANLYDSEPAGQKTINFKYFAELLKNWLLEQL